MSQNTQEINPIHPPADVPEIQRGNWLTLSEHDLVVEYVTANLWDRPTSPAGWKVARLSQAAYIYREISTQWAIVAKFYGVKTGSSAQKHARRELEEIQLARSASLSKGDARAVHPLAVWRGVLFLEYVKGLTLEDVIAVRRSHPGRLADVLTYAAEFLVKLHARSIQGDARADFEPAIDYARKVVGQLADHGVLESYPIARRGLDRLIDHWAARPAMEDFTPTLNHGDATTSNFVFPPDGGVVIVDWERFQVSDPASDLGRLIAELTHSVHQHGGSVREAEPFAQHLIDAYCRALPSDWDADALVERARFYRALSTLRIARNGWLSCLDRTALVTQAMGLLID